MDAVHDDRDHIPSRDRKAGHRDGRRGRRARGVHRRGDMGDHPACRLRHLDGAGQGLGRRHRAAAQRRARGRWRRGHVHRRMGQRDATDEHHRHPAHRSRGRDGRLEPADRSAPAAGRRTRSGCRIVTARRRQRNRPGARADVDRHRVVHMGAGCRGLDSRCARLAAPGAGIRERGSRCGHRSRRNRDRRVHARRRPHAGAPGQHEPRPLFDLETRSERHRHRRVVPRRRLSHRRACNGQRRTPAALPVGQTAPPPRLRASRHAPLSRSPPRAGCSCRREPAAARAGSSAAPQTVPATSALGTAVHDGAASVSISCAAGPCSARVVLETAAASPLGDRVQIATITARSATSRELTGTIPLPDWVRAALARARSLPVHVVLEAGGDGIADPVVERDAVLRAGSG